MAPDDLTVPPGTRLIHIGPHKTGTTAVQGAFRLARERLAAHDVGYFGEETGVSYLKGALAIVGSKPQLGLRIPDMRHWAALTADVAAEGDRRVLVSSEFFSGADDRTIGQVIEGLGGQRAHVVVTLRPLTRILPSQWQQYVQNGLRMRYPDWLDGILNKPPGQGPTPTFWQRHRHDRLVSRWAAVAGTGSLTVAVADQPDRLLRTFEALLGLPGGFLLPDDTKLNRSLTLAEAELIRLLNKQIKRREWPEKLFTMLMRRGVIRHMKAGYQPGPDDQPIVTPPWALKRAAEIGAEMAAGISALGVRVTGNISVLGGLPDGAADMGPDSLRAEPVLPAAAASQAVLGTIVASGIPRQLAAAEPGQPQPEQPRPARGAAKPQPIEDRPVREVDARTLVRVLARRGRRRIRRRVRRPA